MAPSFPPALSADHIEVDLACLLEDDPSAAAAMPTTVFRLEFAGDRLDDVERDAGGGDNAQAAAAAATKGAVSREYADCSRLAGMRAQERCDARQAFLAYVHSKQGKLPLLTHGGIVTVRFRLDPRSFLFAHITNSSWHSARVTLPAQ